MPTPDGQKDPSAVEDPATWTTGAEETTGPQKSYLHTLAQRAGEDPEALDDLTRAEASVGIDGLQEKARRGA